MSHLKKKTVIVFDNILVMLAVHDKDSEMFLAPSYFLILQFHTYCSSK